MDCKRGGCKGRCGEIRNDASIRVLPSARLCQWPCARTAVTHDHAPIRLARFVWLTARAPATDFARGGGSCGDGFTRVWSCRARSAARMEGARSDQGAATRSG
eukprot:3312852-Pleurochrysis_carterae.AAC.4